MQTPFFKIESPYTRSFRGIFCHVKKQEPLTAECVEYLFTHKTALI